MKRIIYAVFTLVVIVFSVHFSSCKGNNGNQSKNDETTAPLTLSNWEDTLAYALGVRYYQEKSTGYSRSLKEYLASSMVAIYGNENYNEYFQSISKRAASDAEKGCPVLPFSYVGDFLNLVDCENRILGYENEIALAESTEKANRMMILMNLQYKRIMSILRTTPPVSYSFSRIENYEHKRDSILALPQDKFNLPSNSNTSTSVAAEIPEKNIGNWTLKDSHYDSPSIKDEYGDGMNVRFVISKEKIEIIFNERIESEYEMKLIVNDDERTLTGNRNGKTFTVSSSNETSTILAAMDRGNFALQYMFLDPGASHWGWINFPIDSQLKQATQAYNALNK